MGRLIDVDSLILEQQSLEDVGQGIMEFYSKEQINNAETVEAIPKADYEARLKADMVAMLTDIQLEIEELDLKDSMKELSEKGADALNSVKKKSEETLNKINEALSKENDYFAGWVRYADAGGLCTWILGGTGFFY